MGNSNSRYLADFTYLPSDISDDIEILTDAHTQLSHLKATTVAVITSGLQLQPMVTMSLSSVRSHGALLISLSRLIQTLQYLKDVDPRLLRSNLDPLRGAMIKHLEEAVGRFPDEWNRRPDFISQAHWAVVPLLRDCRSAVEKLHGVVAVCSKREEKSMSERDQKATFLLLCRLLPPELAVMCMDWAEYWTLENTTVMLEKMRIPNEESEKSWLLYLTSSEWIGGAGRICGVKVTVASCDLDWSQTEHWTMKHSEWISALKCSEECLEKARKTVLETLEELRASGPSFSETIFEVAFVGWDGPNKRTKWVELSRVKEERGYMDVKELFWRREQMGKRDGMVSLRVTSKEGGHKNWLNYIEGAKIEVFTSAV